MGRPTFPHPADLGFLPTALLAFGLACAPGPRGKPSPIGRAAPELETAVFAVG